MELFYYGNGVDFFDFPKKKFIWHVGHIAPPRLISRTNTVKDKGQQK